jgi:tetratricopeptide (TPR) repeat protein
MNAIKRSLLATALLALASATAQAAPQHHVGDFVFPKSYPGKLMIGQRLAGEVSVTEYMTVLEVQGEWLWVERGDIYNTSLVGPRGWVLTSEVDNIDQQIEWAETLIEKNPSDPDFYEYAALVCRLSDRPDLLRAAISYFSRAIQLAPADPEKYKVRAYCWGELDQYDQAVADLEMAVRLDPTNQSYQDILAAYREEMEVRQGVVAPPAPSAPTGDPGLDKSIATGGVAPAA